MDDDVLGLEVPVHHLLPVHVLDSQTDLLDPDGGVPLAQPPLSLH